MVVPGHPRFCYQSKALVHFLFVINSINLGTILPLFRDIAGFLLKTATPPLFHPNFGDVPLGL